MARYKPQLTHDALETIKKHRDNGKPPSEIARAMGMPPYMISKALRIIEYDEKSAQYHLEKSPPMCRNVAVKPHESIINAINFLKPDSAGYKLVNGEIRYYMDGNPVQWTAIMEMAKDKRFTTTKQVQTHEYDTTLAKQKVNKGDEKFCAALKRSKTPATY